MSNARAPGALLDSNVLVAALAETHQHHAESMALLVNAGSNRFCVAAHSYAEAFTTLTRQGGAAPFRRGPEEVVRALHSVAAATRLIGLTPAQTLEAVGSFAAAGGIGARIYDWLIGQAAVMAGVGAIITWNTGHMRSLFPRFIVLTPAEYAERPPVIG